MRHGLIVSILAASLTGCAVTEPSSSRVASAAATASIAATDPSTKGSTPWPAASPGVAPTLTPLSTPGDGRGSWTAVKGSALVAPTGIATGAGRQGVLLLGTDNPCETPERESPGTAAAFYDARKNVIRSVAANVELRGFAVVSLGDGRVMIAGGYGPKDSFAKPTRRTRIWDPRTQAWSEGARMNVGRSYPFLARLADGRVMAAGGSVGADESDCSGCETETDKVELYDPRTNRWMTTSPIRLEMPDGGDADQLGALTALSGGQVLATGANDSGALYDPITEAWTIFAWDGGWGPLALPDGTAVSFGVEFYGTDGDVEVPFASRFDPSGSTSIVGHRRPLDGAATAALADGRVFFAGGVVEDQTGYLGVFMQTVEIFDPRNGQWSELASMPAKRGGATAVPLDDGSVLVIGGVDVAETQPATEEESGNDLPRCVPAEQRVIRWTP